MKRLFNAAIAGAILVLLAMMTMNARQSTPLASSARPQPQPTAAMLSAYPAPDSPPMYVPAVYPSPIMPPATGRTVVAGTPIVELLVRVMGLMLDGEGYVVQVTPSYGAEAAGIQVGDQVLQVDEIRFDAKSERAKGLLQVYITNKRRDTGDSKVLVAIQRKEEMLQLAVETKPFTGDPEERQSMDITPTASPQDWKFY